MRIPSSIPRAAAEAAPAVRVVDIRDPTAVGEGVEVVDQNAVLLKATPFQARRIAVRLGSASLLFYSTNAPLRARTALQGGLTGCVAFGPRAAGTANGLPVGAGRVLAAGPGCDAEFVVAAGYESVTFLLPPDDLGARLQGRPRENRSFLLRCVKLLQAGPDIATRFYACAHRIAEAAASQPGVFDEPQTQCVAYDQLVELLMATLDSTADADPAPRDLTRQAHSRIVRAAEDFALRHDADPLYVADLCEAARVSERTLQYAFRQVVGMTPTAFLTRLRLHRVRQALRGASSRTTTVTREAMRWGFWHLGDFSRAYKDCFGELPSRTLRRD